MKRRQVRKPRSGAIGNGNFEMAHLKRFVHDESGATAIEYGLIAAIIGVGILASLSNIRDSYNAIYNKINNGLSS